MDCLSPGKDPGGSVGFDVGAWEVLDDSFAASTLHPMLTSYSNNLAHPGPVPADLDNLARFHAEQPVARSLAQPDIFPPSLPTTPSRDCGAGALNRRPPLADARERLPLTRPLFAAFPEPAEPDAQPGTSQWPDSPPYAYAVISLSEHGELRSQSSASFLPNLRDRVPRSVYELIAKALQLLPVTQSSTPSNTRIDIVRPLSVSTRSDTAGGASGSGCDQTTRSWRSSDASPSRPVTPTLAGPADKFGQDRCNAMSSRTNGLEDVEEMRRTVSVRVGDQDALQKFYLDRFRHLQQIPCKSIAKDWIKAIEPKKQTKYPYNGGAQRKGDNGQSKDAGESTKPPWWPPAGCPHREPDHINKEERLCLLMHLLRKLWNPDSKEYFAATDVETLRSSTRKTAGAWEKQEKYEENSSWLNDIYHMREYEERLWRKEIDGSMSVSFAALPEPRKDTRKDLRKPKRASKGAPAAGQFFNYPNSDDEFETGQKFSNTNGEQDKTTPIAAFTSKIERSSERSSDLRRMSSQATGVNAGRGVPISPYPPIFSNPPSSGATSTLDSMPQSAAAAVLPPYNFGSPTHERSSQALFSNPSSSGPSPAIGADPISQTPTAVSRSPPRKRSVSTMNEHEENHYPSNIPIASQTTARPPPPSSVLTPPGIFPPLQLPASPWHYEQPVRDQTLHAHSGLPPAQMRAIPNPSIPSSSAWSPPARSSYDYRMYSDSPLALPPQHPVFLQQRPGMITQQQQQQDQQHTISMTQQLEDVQLHQVPQLTQPSPQSQLPQPMALPGRYLYANSGPYDPSPAAWDDYSR